MRTIMLAVSALAMGASPAAAQTVDVGDVGGLVNVTIPANILNNSLNQNEIEILNDNNVNIAAPISVQLPIGIAANFCGVAANVLVADLKQDGQADCTASNASRALGQQVLRQHARQP